MTAGGSTEVVSSLSHYPGHSNKINNLPLLEGTLWSTGTLFCGGTLGLLVNLLWLQVSP